MITDLEKLASLRVDKTSDNRDIKPVDLLRSMVHDIESGRLKADGLVVVYIDRSNLDERDYGHVTLGDCRCGMTIEEQIAALARLQYMKIKESHQ